MENVIDKTRNRIKNTWHWLKRLFHKREEDNDIAMFHCSDCGHDFEAKRHLYDINCENTTFTKTYFPAKCPNCGNWATAPRTIGCIVCGPPRMPCVENDLQGLTEVLKQ